jgi:hypothetical protein
MQRPRKLNSSLFQGIKESNIPISSGSLGGTMKAGQECYALLHFWACQNIIHLQRWCHCSTE